MPLKSAFISIVLAAIPLAGFSLPAANSPLAGAVMDGGPGPLLVPIKANQCVRLVRGQGGVKLLNSCSTCRIVKVLRKRPGNTPPVFRTYTVPRKSTTDLPFRGPGASRVVSDISCRGDAEPGPTESKPDGRQCVQIHRTKSGDLTLYNSCAVCRLVVAERLNQPGGRSRQTFSIAGRSFAPLPARGAEMARIITDKSCQ